MRNLSLSQAGNSAKKWEGGFHRGHEEEVVAEAVKSRARCTTLKAVGASETKFMLGEFFTSFLLKLFYVQLRYSLALRVLVLVV